MNILVGKKAVAAERIADVFQRTLEEAKCIFTSTECASARVHFPKCTTFGEMHKEGKGVNPLVLYRDFG